METMKDSTFLLLFFFTSTTSFPDLMKTRCLLHKAESEVSPAPSDPVGRGNFVTGSLGPLFVADHPLNEILKLRRW